MKPLLMPDNEIADDHAVVGVDRFLGGYRFRAETSARPNLIDTEQGIIVRPGVSPAASRFGERVEQSRPQWNECRIARRRVEITADDQVCRMRDSLHALHDFQYLSAVFDSVVAMVGPETGRPKVETKNGRIQTHTDDVNLDAGW